MRNYIKVPLTTLVRVKKIVTCFKDTRPPDYAARPESHDFWELVYVESGRMTATAGDRDVEMKAGDAIFHAPNVSHALHGNGENAFSFFIVTFDCDSVAMQSLAGHCCMIPPNEADLLKRIYFERTRSLVTRNSDLVVRENAPLGGLQMIQLYLEQFLIGILRAEQGKTGANLYVSRSEMEYHLACEVQDYLERHLTKNVTMDELCQKMHYGKTRLSEIFRKVFGDSIMHYFLSRKLDCAAKELRDHSAGVADVAARFGFESTQYFSRVFHRYFGVSPRDYRKK